MELFYTLVGKQICLMYCGEIVNTFKITTMRNTKQAMEGRGELYECHVDWSNKNIKGATPVMEFDEQTLKELAIKNMSACPWMPDMVMMSMGLITTKND